MFAVLEQSLRTNVRREKEAPLCGVRIGVLLRWLLPASQKALTSWYCIGGAEFYCHHCMFVELVGCVPACPHERQKRSLGWNA